MGTDTGIDEFFSLFGAKRVSDTLKKMADIETNHCLLNIKKAEDALAPYEERFQMKSKDAWEKYQRGKLGDDIEIMEWMGLYENLLAFEQQLKRIKNSQAYAELLRSTN